MEKTSDKKIGNLSKVSYIKDYVYGAVDGTITTFAIISGVMGANLSPKIVIILRIANLVADGFSMAVSNFLGTRAQQELLDNTRRQEKILIDNNPEQQKEELKKLFRDKGFRLEMVEDIANSIARDKKLWLDTILREKHDMPLRGSNPLRAGFSTLMAFVVAGAIPILPFLVLLVTQKESTEIFVWSAAAAAFTFLIIGALKSVITGSLWLRSSLETLFIGGIAASLAYLIGRLLKDIATSL